MHGIGAQAPVEVLGQHPRVGDLPFGQHRLKPALGIVGQIEFADAAPRVAQDGLDGVDAEDEALLGVAEAGGALLPGSAGPRGSS